MQKMPTLLKEEILKKLSLERENLREQKGKSLRKKIVMSIDLSLKSPGVSVVNLNENKVVYCDDFLDKSYKSDKYWQRLDVVIDYIIDIFDTFKPELVMLENAFMAGRTAKSNMPLIMARGALVNKLRLRGAKGRGGMPSQASKCLGITPNTKEHAF